MPRGSVVRNSATVLLVVLLNSYLFEVSRNVGVVTEPALRLSWASTQDGETDEAEALLFTPGINLYILGKNWIALNLDRYDPASGPSEWSLKVQAYAFY